LREVVGCSEDEIDLTAVHMRRRLAADLGRSQEFDVVAACGEYVLINETKSSLDAKDVDDFGKLLAEVRDFFPEYADRRFIGAIAALYVDKSLVRYGEKTRFDCAGVRPGCDGGPEFAGLCAQKLLIPDPTTQKARLGQKPGFFIVGQTCDEPSA
jgi:hypothetical protein